jgi:Tol biopolymer transport system component
VFWLKAATFSFVLAAALLYLGWQFWYLPWQAEKTVPFARYEPISSMLGLEYNAAVSTDGKHMVYNHLLPDYETFELVLQNLDNVETRVLLSQKGLLSGPTWSPDGQKIAYQQKNDSDHCAIKMITLNAEKTAVVADEVLTPCGAKSLGGRLSWSPDGAYLVYPNTPEGLQHTVLMLYAFAGGKQEQLTTPPQTSLGDFAVRFSKKGDQLVFVRDNGGSAGQLWVMDLASRASRLLINLSGLYPMNVDWYDNDRKIIYPTSNSTISVVDVNTGHSEVLLNTFSRASDTLVSQQGKIYSTIGDYRKTNVLKVQNPLYQQNPTSEQLFQSSQSETSAEMHPLEGGPTAVLTSRSGLRQIWFYYPDGRQKQISNFSEAIMYKGMEFSADGRLLLANIGNDVWIFSDNEKPLRVNKADQVARNPSWSHDGLSVYFSVGHQGRWQIVKVNRATLEQEVFATDLDFFKESPDGRYQVMHRIADDVYQVKFNDGRVIELPRNTNDFSVPHFILRAEHLYFSLKVHDNRNDIKALHLQSGEIKETGLMMNFSLKRFAVSMDEKFIYALQGAPGDMDIVEVKPQ